MFDEMDKKFKIIMLTVLLLSVITFSLFIQDIQSKNINNGDDEEQKEETEDEIRYRKIADVKYCEKINLKPYNETHCYS